MGDRLIVAHSTVADGSMLNRNDPGDPKVFANRERWLESVGVPIEQTYRIGMTYDGVTNFCRYREVSPNEIPANMYDKDNEVADALVTTKPGEAIFLPIADCIGVVLFDEINGVLMLSHLGRQSLEQHGGIRSVEYLVKNYGTDPAQLKLWLSAAIGKDLYKIYALEHKGMKEALYEQLDTAGVDRANIQDTDHDTGTHENYYSHSEFLKGNRPTNGRHAIVAMMKH